MSELELMEEIGDNIRYFMHDANMSQADLAKATGLSKGTISKYISGSLMPSIPSIINIAYALCCEVSDLITADEEIF